MSLSITKESIGKIVKTNNNHICKIHTTSKNGVHGKKQMLLILKCYSYIVYVYFKQDSNSFQTTFIATLRFFHQHTFLCGGEISQRRQRKTRLGFCSCLLWMSMESKTRSWCILLQLLLPAKFQDSITCCSLLLS